MSRRTIFFFGLAGVQLVNCILTWCEVMPTNISLIISVVTILLCIYEAGYLRGQLVSYKEWLEEWNKEIEWNKEQEEALKKLAEEIKENN